MTFNATPPTFTLLHGQIIPEHGGDTLWASATAAYRALSEPMQRLLENLRAVHDFRHGFRESLAEPGGEERLAETVAANPPISHPVIRTHPETGARAIYVNPLFTTHIEGLTAAESRDILNFLYRHIVTPEFTVRLSWKPHTLAIWDNRSVQHKPINDFFPQHRKLQPGDHCRRPAPVRASEPFRSYNGSGFSPLSGRDSLGNTAGSEPESRMDTSRQA